MRCRRCESDNPSRKRFCGDCGAPLINSCPKCGAENPPGKRFCGDCGSSLGAKGTSSAADANLVSSAAVRLTRDLGPDAGALIEGERKTVTALFADIKGSMELMEQFDPEEA